MLSRISYQTIRTKRKCCTHLRYASATLEVVQFQVQENMLDSFEVLSSKGDRLSASHERTADTEQMSAVVVATQRGICMTVK